MDQFLEIYSKFLQKFLRVQKPLKVVFDCSNGTAGLVLKKILKAKNSKLKAIFLNEKPDGNFPAHGPNPSKPGAAKQLQAAVKKHKADLGIIFDADGDRMLCIDDKGRLVDPEVITRLLIWRLKPKKAVIDAITGWLVKNFQFPPTKSRVLDKVGTISNFQLLTSKVGNYFLKQKMRADNADFGAERSGHYYFKEFFGLDSGILAAIQVINAVSCLPYKLSDFVDFLPKYYHQEIDFKLSKKMMSENQLEILKKVENHYKQLPITNYKLQNINHLDGLTMEFSGWWFNIRPSQTEPLLRLNIEAKENSKLQEEIIGFKKFLK